MNRVFHTSKKSIELEQKWKVLSRSLEAIGDVFHEEQIMEEEEIKLVRDLAFSTYKGIFELTKISLAHMREEIKVEGPEDKVLANLQLLIDNMPCTTEPPF